MFIIYRHELINDVNYSDYFVMYFRFLTSAYIKSNPFLFESFLDESYTIERFI